MIEPETVALLDKLPDRVRVWLAVIEPETELFAVVEPDNVKV